MDSNGPILATFGIYLVAMLAVGVFSYWRTRNLSDYILAGRRLGSFVTALSAEASDMSGWLLLGLPGYAYVAGLEAMWIAVGLLAGTYLVWRLMAARLRRHTAGFGDSLTLSDYFEFRFKDETHALRIISAVFILLFFMIYTGSGLVASSKLFNTVFGLDPGLSMVGGAAVIIAYTFLGGFIAVCWTDCVQGILMFAALVAVPLVAILKVGGWGAASASLLETNPELLNVLTDREGNALGIIGIVSLMGWGLGYFGQPHILARFMAIDEVAHISRARKIAVSWCAVTLFGAVLVGIAGVSSLETSLEGGDSEKVFMILVESLFHPVVAGIWLAAILAAIMSTVDSQLLVSSSVLAEDFYKAFLRKDATQKELVWAGRGAVVLIAFCALALAVQENKTVLDIVAYAWAGFGASFGPVLLFGLYCRNTTRNAALAGIIVGGVTVVVWNRLSGGLFDLYEIVPGFLLSSVTIALVSRLEWSKAADLAPHFDAVDSVDLVDPVDASEQRA